MLDKISDQATVVVRVRFLNRQHGGYQSVSVHQKVVGEVLPGVRPSLNVYYQIDFPQKLALAALTMTS
jgi:hypothetical protein